MIVVVDLNRWGDSEGRSGGDDSDGVSCSGCDSDEVVVMVTVMVVVDVVTDGVVRVIDGGRTSEWGVGGGIDGYCSRGDN